jgi:hypothetical protein
MTHNTAPSSGPRSAPDPFGFHKGIVVAWDALAGTNQVRVAGADIENLQSLMGAEVGLIRVGDTVSLLRFQNTYAVLGRIEAAGVEQRVLGVHSAEVVADAAPSTSTFTDKGGPTVSVHIGSTRRCRVSLSCEASIAGTIMWMGFKVAGASSIAAAEWRSLAIGGADVYFEGSREVVLTAADGLNAGTNIFTAMYRIGSNGDPVPIVAERQIIVQPF